MLFWAFILEMRISGVQKYILFEAVFISRDKESKLLIKISLNSGLNERLRCIYVLYIKLIINFPEKPITIQLAGENILSKWVGRGGRGGNYSHTL